MHFYLLPGTIHHKKVRGGTRLGGLHLVLITFMDKLNIHCVRQCIGTLDLAPEKTVSRKTYDSHFSFSASVFLEKLEEITD
jgi:hypothetical protein